MKAIPADDGLEAQRALISKLEGEGFGWDLLVGDAFVRGMRDIGYKSTSFALAELIDNAIQASASHVDVVFGFGGGAKPTKLAVVDNGYGMEPKMVRASLVWGAGTHYEDRSGFAKYGYGLPSASVSQCHRVTVYSKMAEGNWHSAYLDIDEIQQGQWTKGNRIEMPEQVQADPPPFVVDYLKRAKRWDNLRSGTVVVWDGLDRVEPRLREGLRASLVTNLGVIYRRFLLDCPMTVDGVSVEPCDPLFVTEGFRYHDLDEDRAIALEPAVAEVKDKDSSQPLGKLRVRFARMPATFFRKPEAKRSNKPSPKQMNERLEIADANNGIIFCRNGRQIGVVRPPRALGSINSTTDRFWAVEVDFDASLDELFAVTTSKQQVQPDDRIWNILKDKVNLFSIITEVRNIYKKEARLVAVEAEANKGQKRASVEAIESAAKFRTTKPPKQTVERKAESENNLSNEAQKRARRSGLEQGVVRRELVAEREGQTHAVETEDLPGAAFFRCVDEGGTRVLYLNVAHPFYAELYAGPGSDPRLRAGLEVVLWALGEAEADAEPESERRRFYERDRASIWSPFIADSLAILKNIPTVADRAASDDTAA